ncbi:MAG: hypothetical protein ACRER2_16870 [Methylococcales bacterium]
MSKIFEIKLKGDPEEILTKARGSAVGHGVRFTGDARTGRFQSHGFEGNYRIMEDVLAIRITKKPIFIPWALIETTLRGYFS